MKFLVHTEDIVIPEGSRPFSPTRYSPLLATVDEKARVVTVTKGEKRLIRKFKHTTFEIIDGMHNKLKVPCKKVRMWCATKKLKARTRTIASHIKNMIQGVDGVILIWCEIAKSYNDFWIGLLLSYESRLSAFPNCHCYL